MSGGTDNPWLAGDGDRGRDYHQRMRTKAADGAYMHGEADLVQSYAPTTVLDAGCGTGRVGIELATRGLDVVGVDLDPTMLVVAREQAPGVPWIESDLVDLELDRTFDVVLGAGNVMVFLTPGTEGVVVERLANHLGAEGLLVVGFALRGGPSGIDLDLADYDAWCTEAGLALFARFANWEGEPYAGQPYAVSVHRRS